MPTILGGKLRFGATIAVVDKDVGLGLDEAKAFDVPMWGIEQAARLWRFAASQGKGGEDLAELVRIVEGWAGAEIRSRKRGESTGCCAAWLSIRGGSLRARRGPIRQPGQVAS